MRRLPLLPVWSMAAPALSWLALAGAWLGLDGWYLLVVAAALIASVLAAVHHAEVIAHRIGEPYGTLLLAFAITAIEVALIVVLMVSGRPPARKPCRGLHGWHASGARRKIAPTEGRAAAPRALNLLA